MFPLYCGQRHQHILNLLRPADIRLTVPRDEGQPARQVQYLARCATYQSQHVKDMTLCNLTARRLNRAPKNVTLNRRMLSSERRGVQTDDPTPIHPCHIAPDHICLHPDIVAVLNGIRR